MYAHCAVVCARYTISVICVLRYEKVDIGHRRSTRAIYLKDDHAPLVRNNLGLGLKIGLGLNLGLKKTRSGSI